MDVVWMLRHILLKSCLQSLRAFMSRRWTEYEVKQMMHEGVSLARLFSRLFCPICGCPSVSLLLLCLWWSIKWMDYRVLDGLISIGETCRFQYINRLWYPHPTRNSSWRTIRLRPHGLRSLWAQCSHCFIIWTPTDYGSCLHLL